MRNCPKNNAKTRKISFVNITTQNNPEMGRKQFFVLCFGANFLQDAGVLEKTISKRIFLSSHFSALLSHVQQGKRVSKIC